MIKLLFFFSTYTLVSQRVIKEMTIRLVSDLEYLFDLISNDRLNYFIV